MLPPRLARAFEARAEDVLYHAWRFLASGLSWREDHRVKSGGIKTYLQARSLAPSVV